jgi:enoyl-CoA hydratase/carnithine racemase
MPEAQLRIIRTSPALWRVTFDHPPLNLIDPGTLRELDALVGELESDEDVRVVVFDSADADYFLAHYDIAIAPELSLSMPNGPTGMAPFLDVTTRLSRVGVVSIAKIRGRARGAGSEFVLACDLRFASAERAVLSQPEVGLALVPGGGPMARLPQLTGRARALEILLAGNDFDGRLAERYGYVNRALPDAELDAFVDGLAARIASFDKFAIGRIKDYVNEVSLPDASVMPAALDTFWESAGREGAQRRIVALAEKGLQQRGDIELRLGDHLAPDA